MEYITSICGLLGQEKYMNFLPVFWLHAVIANDCNCFVVVAVNFFFVSKLESSPGNTVYAEGYFKVSACFAHHN